MMIRRHLSQCFAAAASAAAAHVVIFLHPRIEFLLKILEVLFGIGRVLPLSNERAVGAASK